MFYRLVTVQIVIQAAIKDNSVGPNVESVHVRLAGGVLTLLYSCGEFAERRPETADVSNRCVLAIRQPHRCVVSKLVVYVTAIVVVVHRQRAPARR